MLVASKIKNHLAKNNYSGLIVCLILIIITINDLIYGIELDSFIIELNKIKEIIPHKIHQICETNDLLAYSIDNSHTKLIGIPLNVPV